MIGVVIGLFVTALLGLTVELAAGRAEQRRISNGAQPSPTRRQRRRWRRERLRFNPSLRSKV